MRILNIKLQIAFEITFSLWSLNFTLFENQYCKNRKERESNFVFITVVKPILLMIKT